MMRLQNGYAISAVPTQMIPEAWPNIKHLLEEALSYSWGFRPGDVYQKLRENRAILWVVEKDMEIVAATVTEIIEYPTCRTLNIWLLAGVKFWEWQDLVASMEAFARSNGCEWIEATGRPGLQRLLKEMGFNVPRVVCAKKIDTTTH